MNAVRWACSVLLLVSGACKKQALVEPPAAEARDASPPPSVASVTAPVPDGREERESLAGYPSTMELRDGSDFLGVVSVPVGTREPRPIMVALHGGSDRPERACPMWRAATDAYPFIVCPRGWGGNERHLGWRSVVDSQQRITRAIEAAKKAFGPWIIETSTVVLAGFSMGASQVARIAATEPAKYRRIVIGDAAHDPRPALSFSRAWTSGGGERAMFMCTTSGCEPSMRAAAKIVAAQRTTASARLVIAPTQKHALSLRAASSLRRDWSWLVEGAEGWDAYVAPSNPPSDARTEPFDPP